MQTLLRHGTHMFSSLSIRNYRLFFIGQAVSLSGTWMQIVAFGWLTLELTGSGTSLGVVTALQFLPVLLFGPWGGLMADRLDKRKLLFYTQAVSAVFALTLGALVFSGRIELWMLYCFAFLLGLVKVPENPTRQTLVSEMVGKEALGNAVVLNSTQVNLARMVGPMIGGVLIASFGIAFCFFANALTYGATLLSLALMREKELHRAPRSEKHRGHLAEGFAYILATPMIRDILVMIILIGTFAIEFQVSLPLLAQGTFKSGAGGYAALLAAMGTGAVLGGLVAAFRQRVTADALSRSALLFGVSMLLTSLMPSMFLALLGMAAVGFFSIGVTSLGNTLIQLESRPEMRGRVMSIWTMAVIGSTPIGGPIVGIIGERVGPRFGLAIGGAAAVLAAAYAFLTLSDRRRFSAASVSAEAEVAETFVENQKIR